jgi:uncharacterized protein YjbI with pentapeptide repeats
MGEIEGTCEYVLDPDDPETWGGGKGDDCYVENELLNDEGVWTCPHDAEENEDLCIFHLPVDKNSDEATAEAFFEIINNDEVEGRKNEFVGSKFGNIKLRDDKEKEIVNERVELAHSKIGGDINSFAMDIGERSYSYQTTDTVFRTEINLSGVVFQGNINFCGTSFLEDVIFNGAKFESFATFAGATFEKDVNFNDAVFEGRTAFRTAHFHGDGQFKNVEFSPPDQAISFESTIFKGEANFSRTVFRCILRFSDSIFNESTSFRYSEFIGSVEFVDTTFEFDINFKSFTFEEDLRFNEASIGGIANFRNVVFDSASFREARFGVNSTIGGNTDFRNSKFEGLAVLSWVIFNGMADFSRVRFNKGLNFECSNFKGKADFRKISVGSRAKFSDTTFEGNSLFSSAIFRDVTIFNQALFEIYAEFRGVEFKSDVHFQNAIFKRGPDFEGARTDFTGAEFGGTPVFTAASLPSSLFPGVDLTEGSFANATLCEANLERALLSRASLSGCDLRGAKLSGTVLGGVRIDEDTKLLGHPSDDNSISRHTLSAIRSRPCCVYDSRFGKSKDSIFSRLRSKLTGLMSSEETTKHETNNEVNPDKAKGLYRVLEELGRKHARPQLQTNSFVRRKDIQKDEYKEETKEPDSLEELSIAGIQWAQAEVARVVLLYGESPWRIIGWSLGIILWFALLYPLGGWMKPTDQEPITYAQIASNPAEILNSVYYSTLTYTALGFGDFQPVGFGRALTTIETGLGAVLLALLVFVLGRRAAR